ncbi:MAG: DUF1211 domain-containing protein [Bauldia sp.]|nr:DUF1211 domain-containing protein [Bauldia sp.]
MEKSRAIDRLGAFTDGVLAIVITLLVLDIALPADAETATESQLAAALLAIWPKYLSYVISFLVIANFWMLHTSKFRALKTINATFVWLNILFLMVVGFIPFTTSVLSDSGGTVATTLYAATMAVASALLALMGFYAEARGLVDKPVASQDRVKHIILSLAATAIFLASIVIAQFSAAAAQYSWALLFVIVAFVRPKHSEEARDPFAS